MCPDGSNAVLFRIPSFPTSDFDSKTGYIDLRFFVNFLVSSSKILEYYFKMHNDLFFQHIFEIIFKQFIVQFDAMGMWRVWGRGEVCTGFWWGNLRERDHWGDPDVDGRIILRWIFRKWEGVVGTG